MRTVLIYTPSNRCPLALTVRAAVEKVLAALGRQRYTPKMFNGHAGAGALLPTYISL